MNLDDIIRMAREAGIEAESDTLCRYEGWVDPLERFAALVAAAEREACAKVCEEVFSSTGRTFDHRAVAAAIRARSQE